jgi:hypothetical protein
MTMQSGLPESTRSRRGGRGEVVDHATFTVALGGDTLMLALVPVAKGHRHR